MKIFAKRLPIFVSLVLFTASAFAESLFVRCADARGPVISVSFTGPYGGILDAKGIFRDDSGRLVPFHYVHSDYYAYSPDHHMENLIVYNWQPGLDGPGNIGIMLNGDQLGTCIYNLR